MKLICAAIFYLHKGIVIIQIFKPIEEFSSNFFS